MTAIKILRGSRLSYDSYFHVNSSKRLSLTRTTSKMEQQNENQKQAKFFAVSLLILISSLGTIGNLLVLKAIITDFKRKKLHEYLILNLAVTDAGTCIVSIPLDIVEQVIGEFPYGAALCHVIYPFQSVLLYVSVMTLLFMTLERYRLIVTPLKPTIRVKTGLITIAVMWAASCLIVLPFSLALKLTNNECSEQWPHALRGKVFTLAIFTFLYVIPLIIMTFLYTFMIRVLHKDSKDIRQRTNRSLSQASIDHRLHRNVRIVKIFVVAVVAFALCMLPTHVSWLWHDFGHGSKSPAVFGKVLLFSNIFMYANSLLNPFIFGSIHVKTLANRFTALVCYRLRRQERPERRQGSAQKVFYLRTHSPSMSRRFKIRSKNPELSNRNTKNKSRGTKSNWNYYNIETSV